MIRLPAAVYNPSPITVINAKVPRSLDLHQLGIDPKWHDYARVLISLVANHRRRRRARNSRRKKDRDGAEEMWTPLPSDFARDAVFHGSPKLLGQLVKAGVLERTRYTQPDRARGLGGRCRDYRLGARYRNDRLRTHPVTHHEVIKKRNGYRAKCDEKMTSVLKGIRAWYYRVNVVDGAPLDKCKSLRTLAELRHRRFYRDRFGRIHTLITNLPREYRQYVRLAGQEFWSVDVKTSQPLLLGIQLRQEIEEARRRERDREGRREERREGASTRGEGEGREGTEGRTGYDAVTYLDRCLMDVVRFIHDCVHNDVYAMTMDDVNRELVTIGLPGDWRRDDAKASYMPVMFGRADHMGTLCGRAVQRLWPGVYDRIQSVAQASAERELPRRMQRRESDIMIEGVAACLVRDHPEVPFLPLHDAILTPKEHIGLVEGLIRESWQAACGVSPKVDPKEWTAPEDPKPKRTKRRLPRRPAAA